MNKGDVIRTMADKLNFTLKDTDDAYKAFVETVAEALKAGEDVALAGFGTFKVKTLPARQGINPKTKETIMIPESKNPTFKFGQSFKDSVQ